LKEFQEQINIILQYGFKPIAVSQIYFEDTFVFETNKEAKKAFETLENCEDYKVVGWWYGKKEFKKFVKEYEKKFEGYKVLIHWLDI
jgi:hypothetical protein